MNSLLSRRNACLRSFGLYTPVILICCSNGSLMAQGSVTTLMPDLTFELKVPSLPGGLKIREMRSGPADLWFLVQNQRGDFSIVQTDLAGRSQSTIGLPPGARASGLAATSEGATTVLFKDRKPTLAQFERGGRSVSETQLGCVMAESLLSIDGDVGVVCPDGAIVRYSATGRVGTYSSWARPGSLVENLRNDLLAVVDQVTGKLLLNNVSNDKLSMASVDAPEMLEARKKNDAASAAMRAGPLQKQLLVMDTATDSRDVYLLIWPYQSREGPFVIRVNAEGKLVARYACKIPDGEKFTFHKIEIINRKLFLGSVSGVVYRYRL